MKEDFKKELTSLLNRHSWDNACETPDHILADYVENCLKNLCGTITKDIAWHSNWKRLGEDINTFHIEAEKKEEEPADKCDKNKVCCATCIHYWNCKYKNCRSNNWEHWESEVENDR